MSVTKERGDHLTPGVKSFFSFKAASVYSMFTAFTTEAIDKVTT